MAKYELRQPYPGPLQSGKYAAAALRGTPMGAHATDEESFDLAGPTTFIGFSRRDITVEGVTLEHHFWPGQGDNVPEKAGGYVTIERADEVDVEGNDFMVKSGTGQITDQTAVGTQLSFYGGKFRVAQASDQPYFMLAAQLTPETDGDVRIRCAAIR
jgi:hypothetical protein